MSPAVMDPHYSAAVQRLNDAFRTSFIGGRVVKTSGIGAKGEAFENACVIAVQQFSTFTEDNDPHGEHDFGSFEVDGQTCFWKIDYYDATLDAGSENPAKPEITTRVLTILLAEEW